MIWASGAGMPSDWGSEALMGAATRISPWRGTGTRGRKLASALFGGDVPSRVTRRTSRDWPSPCSWPTPDGATIAATRGTPPSVTSGADTRQPLAVPRSINQS